MRPPTAYFTAQDEVSHVVFGGLAEISERVICRLVKIFLQVGFELAAVVVGKVSELEWLQAALRGPHRKQNHRLAADGACSHVKHHFNLNAFVQRLFHHQ